MIFKKYIFLQQKNLCSHIGKSEDFITFNLATLHLG